MHNAATEGCSTGFTSVAWVPSCESGLLHMLAQQHALLLLIQAYQPAATAPLCQPPAAPRAAGIPDPMHASGAEPTHLPSSECHNNTELRGAAGALPQGMATGAPRARAPAWP